MIQEYQRKTKRFWSIYITSILVATLTLSLLLRLFVYTNFMVSGDSMYPTHADKDVVFSTKLSNIERFDVIVFKQGDRNLIKRVIGFGGEDIQYKDDILYINGEEVNEPYKSKLGNYGVTEDFATFPQFKGVVPEGCYYVLGDNRNNSTDSRSKSVGCVPVDAVLGEVKIKLWTSVW